MGFRPGFRCEWVGMRGLYQGATAEAATPNSPLKHSSFDKSHARRWWGWNKARAAHPPAEKACENRGLARDRRELSSRMSRQARQTGARFPYGLAGEVRLSSPMNNLRMRSSALRVL